MYKIVFFGVVSTSTYSNTPFFQRLLKLQYSPLHYLVSLKRRQNAIMLSPCAASGPSRRKQKRWRVLFFVVLPFLSLFIFLQKTRKGQCIRWKILLVYPRVRE